MSAEIVFGQRETNAIGVDALYRFVVVQGDTGAQGLMAGDDAVQGLAQGVAIQAAAQTQAVGHQVGQRGLGIEPGQEPQPLLGEGQRQRCAAVGRHDGRQPAGGGAGHAAGQGMQLRMVEHVPDLKFHAQRAAHPRDQLHGQQRVAAESEEVVIAPQLRQAEQFAPHRGQCLFDRALRLLCVADCIGDGARRYRQCTAVQLAAWCQRQGIPAHIGSRQHVVRQARTQVFAHCLGVDPFGHDVSHQAWFAHVVFARQHQRIVDTSAGQQRRFDLTRFDAEAAQFDLAVGAAEEAQAAVGTPAGQIAGLVHALAGLVGERVGDEAFGSQVGTTQIAARQRRASQMQLAARADRQRLSVAIEHMRLGAGERTANAGRGVGADGLGSCHHHGFGRAVGIQQRRAGALDPGLAHSRGQCFTADNHLAHAVGDLQRLRAQLRPEAGRQIDHGDTGLRALRPELLGVQPGVVAQHQAGAAAQGAEEFLDRSVEGQCGELQHAVLRAQPIGGDQGMQARGQALVGDHHALGLAAGAGGVDHIGQLLRMQPRHQRVVRRCCGPRLGVGIDAQQHRVDGVRQAGQARRVGDQHARRAVGEHALQTLARIGRVQRHVGAAGLEHGQDRDDGVHATLHAQRHTHVRGHAECDQMVRQAVGAQVQAGIVEAACRVLHGDRLGPLCGLPFQQAMHRHRVHDAASSVVALAQLRMVGRAQQRQARDRCVRVGHHRPQRGDEQGDMAFDAAALEQCGGVAEAADQHIAVLGHGDFQVELHGLHRQRHWLQGQAGQCQVAFRRVLPGKHDLEQRAMRGTAHRLERLDDLFEGQVLVRLRRERGRTHLAEQTGGIGCLTQVDLQGQRIDEQADHRLQLGAIASGDRGPDHHLVLTGQARQQHRPAGQQGHEQRGAVALAQAAQRGSEIGIHGDLDRVAAVVLQRRTGALGRQLQQRRGVVQLFNPEVALALQHLAADPAALPHGDIGVLQWQRWQRIGLALGEGGVQGAQFAHQQTHRPAIGNQMVQGDE